MESFNESIRTIDTTDISFVSSGCTGVEAPVLTLIV